MQVLHYRWPVRKSLRPKQNVFALRAIGPILRPVIHKKVSEVEIFVMREDQSFVRMGAQVFLDPKERV